MRHYWIAIVSLFTAVVPLAAYAADAVELSTRISGVVSDVLVKPGQHVKKGSVLLRLDAVIEQAKVSEAAADLDRLQADAADAQRDLDRVQELYKRTVSSTTELDAAKLRQTRAHAALTIAQARLTIAQKNLQDTELKAPFTGVVTRVPAAPGMVVASECQPRALVLMRR
jgi:RND family efflux transporter MFP subunit